MAFIQIIVSKTSKYDEMMQVGAEWEAAAAGDSTVQRRIMCADRDNPGQYINIIFFNSYEDAMKNSELPVTQEFAGRMMALTDGPPTFYNLDVQEDIS